MYIFIEGGEASYCDVSFFMDQVIRFWKTHMVKVQTKKKGLFLEPCKKGDRCG